MLRHQSGACMHRMHWTAAAYQKSRTSCMCGKTQTPERACGIALSQVNPNTSNCLCVTQTVVNHELWKSQDSANPP